MPKEIEFKFGTAFRRGTAIGGKWYADLDESVRSRSRNAELTITICVYFDKIDRTGEFFDSEHSLKRITTWQAGEFESLKRGILFTAQRFWDGSFWLNTPSKFDGLNWPDDNAFVDATHRCNVDCRLKLIDANNPVDAHYIITVVKLLDEETDMSESSLRFSNRIAQPQNKIPDSKVQQWAHIHEVGHLLGLGHVNHRDIMQARGANDLKSYGVTKSEMEDLMGRGSVRHPWQAAPWQEAAAALTRTRKDEWRVSMGPIMPVALAPRARPAAILPKVRTL